MREFVTSAEDALVDEDADEIGQPLVLDGHVLTYFRPVEGQVAIYMADSASRYASTGEKTAATINLFLALFDDESQRHLVTRLLDRNDYFGIKKVQEIMSEMVEEWAGRPTSGSTVSTQSRRSGGPKSTPRTPQLTS